MKSLAIVDPAIASLIEQETIRQEAEINLIASENYASPAVLEASSSTMTNKYAEGYPGKRYYAGCEIVDQAENLAIERCKKLFNAEHVNVQPHAGCQANMAVYFAALEPGDTILGMSLASGGHLTHGHHVNFSGKYFKSVQYGVNKETEQINYEEVEKLAQEHKPKLIVVGASAYARTIDFERFATIAKNIGALLLADIAHIAGLIAADAHPSPFPHADFVTTTTHKTLRGPRGAVIMCKKEWALKIDRAIIPGTQGGPCMHTIAAKAVAFQEALTPAFKEYQFQIIKNAKAMADALALKGFRIVSGTTDNHLFIVDLRSKGITGLQAERALRKAGITVTRSCIPFDPESPWITSGIRLGTPAVTTRGMKEAEMHEIADLIDQAIKHHANDAFLATLGAKSNQLCALFAIYKDQKISELGHYSKTTKTASL